MTQWLLRLGPVCFSLRLAENVPRVCVCVLFSFVLFAFFSFVVWCFLLSGGRGTRALPLSPLGRQSGNG